ncbi:MAG: hypothetical protein ACFBZ8_09550 [Opitutales bacterium]
MRPLEANGTLNVQIEQVRAAQHLRSLLGDIRQGAKDRLVVVAFGDSLATRVAEPFLENECSIWFPTRPYPVITNGAFVRITTEGAHRSKDKTGPGYSYNPIGQYTRLENSERLVIGPLNGSSERTVLPYIRQPGGGTFEMFISDTASAAQAVINGNDYNHVSWRTPRADEIQSSHPLSNGRMIIETTDESISADHIDLVYPAGTVRAVKVEHLSGGEIDILPIYNEYPGLTLYALAAGSNRFLDVNPDCVPNLAALVETVEPDLITLQTDDRGEDYAHFLPLLREALASTRLSSKPVVICFGEGPKNFARSHEGVLGQNAFASSFCAQNDWLFISQFDLAPDFQWLVEHGLGGDGTHLHADFYAMTADYAAAYAGLDFIAYQTWPGEELCFSVSLNSEHTENGLLEVIGSTAPNRPENEWTELMSWSNTAGPQLSSPKVLAVHEVLQWSDADFLLEPRLRLRLLTKDHESYFLRAKSTLSQTTAQTAD